MKVIARSSRYRTFIDKPWWTCIRAI